jgi:hypothetical protein
VFFPYLSPLSIGRQDVVQVWQTILPDLDLPKWFAKLIWHLDLAYYVAGLRFAKTVWQSILPDLDLPKWFAKSIWNFDLAIQIGKLCCRT